MKEFDSASHIFNRCYENVNVRNKVKLQGPEKVQKKKKKKKDIVYYYNHPQRGAVDDRQHIKRVHIVIL